MEYTEMTVNNVFLTTNDEIILSTENNICSFVKLNIVNSEVVGEEIIISTCENDNNEYVLSKDIFNSDLLKTGQYYVNIHYFKEIIDLYAYKQLVINDFIFSFFLLSYIEAIWKFFNYIFYNDI